MDKDLLKLNNYCSKIKKKNKHWHPDTLYEYLQVKKYEFINEKDCSLYELDKKTLQFKLTGNKK